MHHFPRWVILNFLILFIGAASVLITTTPVQAILPNNPGDLDPTFDGDGRLTTDFLGNLSEAQSLVLQQDGKIVAVGYTSVNPTLLNFAVARYNVNGSLDTSFSEDGLVITDILGEDDDARSVVIQPDGKILAAGYAQVTSNYDFALTRYHVNGFLDTTFGNDGVITTDFAGSIDSIESLGIQGDGKIVAVGRTGATFTDFALARYNSDGSLDPTFSGDGLLTTDFSGDADEANSIVFQPDGKLVVGGYANATSDSDFVVARYHPDGSLDTTFSDDGFVTTDFAGNSDVVDSVVLQPDGKIVAVGRMNIVGDQNFALARYNPDGSLDTTFSSDGLVITDFVGAQDEAYGVVLQPDGKIIAAGFATFGGIRDFALARYNSNGSLDATFSADGLVATDFMGGVDEANGIVLQPDGKVLLAGFAFISGVRHFALARYEGDASPTATPTPTNVPTTPTPTPTAIIPTFTPSPTNLPASPTPTPTETLPTLTATPTPTGIVPSLTPTPTGIPATSTPTPTVAVSTSTPTRTPTQPVPTGEVYIPLVLRQYAFSTPAPTPTPPITNTPVPTCEVLDHEPNNFFSQANANLPLCEGGTVAGSVSVNDIDDYYRIQLDHAATVRIDMTGIPIGADYDLYLYDASGGPVTVSNNSGSVNETIRTQLASGRYYIRIYSLNYADPNTYQLRWVRE